MQNRLIQSASEAFGAADLSRSRSNSGSSSRSGSVKSNRGSRSPVATRCSNKILRNNSFRMKASLSLQSIPDSFEGPTSSDVECSDNCESLCLFLDSLDFLDSPFLAVRMIDSSSSSISRLAFD